MMDLEQINALLLTPPWPLVQLQLPEPVQEWFPNDIPDTISRQQLNRQLNDDPAPDGFRDLVRQSGFEVLAYYIPFHIDRPARPWGIYLRQVGIAHVREALEFRLRRDGIFVNFATLDKQAKKILLLHELRHHAIEVTFTICEQLLNHYRYYLDFNERAVTNTRTHDLEEAICNANVAKQAKSQINVTHQQIDLDFRPNITHKLDFDEYNREFMREQPRGYRDFQRHVDTSPEREFELLELPIELLHPVEVPNLGTQYKYHSKFAILNSLPVPIRVV